MIVFAVASELELRSLRRLIEAGHVEVRGGREFFFGKMYGRDVCLVKTGAGRKNAAAAARKICSVLRPDLVIIAGAAGALDPGFDCGATIIVQAIIWENVSEEINCSPERSRRALTVLHSAGMQAKPGRCCQARSFMHRTVDKRTLYEETRADVVDMESAAFGNAFQNAGVPYINIRIVSDSARSDTADMERLVSLRYRRGKKAAAFYLLRHPRELMRVFLFYRGMSIADRRIAEAVSALVAADDFR